MWWGCTCPSVLLIVGQSHTWAGFPAHTVWCGVTGMASTFNTEVRKGIRRWPHCWISRVSTCRSSFKEQLERGSCSRPRSLSSQWLSCHSGWTCGGSAVQGVAGVCQVSPLSGMAWVRLDSRSLKALEAEEWRDSCGFRKVTLAVDWGGD